MKNWLVSYTVHVKLPHGVKSQLETSRHIAELAMNNRLGVVEIVDDDKAFILVTKEDFVDWFGGNEKDV